MIGVWLSRRTSWSPALPAPIRQRRDVGEIYRSGFRVYRSRWPLFVGIGLMAIPLGALAAIAQNLLFGVTGLSAVTDVAVEDPVVGAVAAALFGVFTTLIAATLVYAASVEALDRIDEGAQLNALDAYRGIVPALLPLAWATLRMLVVASLLVLTLVGIPFAIVYLIRRTVTLQSIVIEDLGGTSGLRRSAELVRGSGVRVVAIGALVERHRRSARAGDRGRDDVRHAGVPRRDQSRLLARLRVRATRGGRRHRPALLRPSHTAPANPADHS